MPYVYGLLIFWIGCGVIGAALYLWHTAAVEIRPFDIFMAGALVLLGPFGLPWGRDGDG